METNTSVAIRSINNYHERDLAEVIDSLVFVTGLSSSLSSSKILLKPNLISTRNCHLACTEPAVIEAVAKWFLDHGANVKIGDSPAFGSSQSVLSALGLIPVLGKLGVEIVEFTQSSNVKLPNNIEIKLAAEAADCDLLVNIPRVKAHIQLGVTMAVKNLFGCISGVQKAWYHMLHGGQKGLFAEIIIQIPSVLPPIVTITDGIKAMHKTGPIDGEAINLGLIGCSLNPIALDTAFLDILSITPDKSPLSLAAVNLNLPGSSVDELLWSLQTKDELFVPVFEVPEETMSIRFNPFRFIKSAGRRFFQRLFL